MSRTTPVHSGYTIFNGTGEGPNGDRIDVWVEYKIGSYSIANNTTKFTAYFYAALNPNYTSTTSGTTGLRSAFSVNGVSSNPVSNGPYDFRSPNSLNLLGYFDGNISHNSDGTKTVVIAGVFTTNSSYIKGGSISTLKVVLPTIPRASTIGATDANIGAVSMIAVTRKNSGFTHSIAYQFGSLSGYINADGSPASTEVKLTEASIPFTVPESFYDQIPNAPYGICTLTCKTYSGGTQIGDTQTCTFKATANRDTCAPEVSGTAVDINELTMALTGDENTLVRYYSTVRITPNVTVKNGATLKSLTVNDSAVTGSYLDIANTQTGDFVIKAVDSRGYTGIVNVEKNMIAYIQLTNNASVVRDDPTSGNATVTLSGNYYDGSFGAVDNTLTVSYIIDGGEPITTEPEMTLADGRYKGTVSLSGLDYLTAHTVKITVSDALTSVPKTLTAQKGIPVFDWGENDFQFHVPVSSSIFTGTEFNGVHLQTVKVWGGSSFRLQTKYSAFSGTGNNRQSIMMFGNRNGTLFLGVIGFNDAGTCYWSGTTGVTLTSEEGGIVTVSLGSFAYDNFVLISAEKFNVI